MKTKLLFLIILPLAVGIFLFIYPTHKQSQDENNYYTMALRKKDLHENEAGQPGLMPEPIIKEEKVRTAEKKVRIVDKQIAPTSGLQQEQAWQSDFGYSINVEPEKQPPTVQDVERKRWFLTEQFMNEFSKDQPDILDMNFLAAGLAALGDEHSLSTLFDSYMESRNAGKYQTSNEILRAISIIDSPALINQLDNYSEIAITQNDDQLLSAVTNSLAKIGTFDAVNKLKRIITSSDPTSDVPLIVSNSISMVRNPEAIPELSEIVSERIIGYEDAVEALINMGEPGITELSNLFADDREQALQELLFSMKDTMEFDGSTIETFQLLAQKDKDNALFYEIIVDEIGVIDGMDYKLDVENLNE